MERLVKDASKMTDVQKELGVTVDGTSLSFGNIVNAISVVQKKMGIAGTTTKEAEGTITGSLNSVKGAWGNLLVAMASGDEIDGYIKDMTDTLEIFLGNIVPIAEKSLAGIGTLVEKLAPIIAEKLPPLAEKLIPPLISAAVDLVKGLIKALPQIIKSVAIAIVDAFGKQFPIIGKIANFFSDNADTIASAIKKIIPAVIALVGAFKLFKGIKSITSIFGGKGGGKGGKGGGLFGCVTNTFKELAKTSPKTILKGMLNLSIILGGFAVLSIAFAVVASFMKKIGNTKNILELVVVVAALGAVSTVLTKFAKIASKIPVKDVVKGLANMAIMLGGLTVLFMVIGAVSLLNFDTRAILEIVAVIGAISLIGTAAALLAAVVGMIPIPVVAMGLAGIAIIIAGFTGIIVAFGALTQIPGFSDFIENGGRILVEIFNILGQVVGAVIGGVAEGITNSLPTIGENLANFGIALQPLFHAVDGVDVNSLGAFFLAIGGFLLEMAGEKLLSFFTGETDIASIGTQLNDFADTSKSAFDKFAQFSDAGIEKAPRILSSIGGIGNYNFKTGGLAQLGTGTTDIASIGTQLSSFAENAQVAFERFAVYSEAGIAKAPAILSSIGGIGDYNFKTGGLAQLGTGTTDIAGIGTQLSSFAENAQGAFEKFARFPDLGIEKAPKILSAIQGIGDYNFKSGGLAQLATGTTDIAGIGTQLDSFAHSAQSAFNAFSEYPKLGIENAPKILEGIKGIGNFDFKSGGLAQLVTGGTDIAGVGTQLDSFAHSAQSAFNAFSEYPDLGIENAPKILDAIKGIGDFDFKSGGLAQWITGGTDIASIGTQLDSFAHSAQSAFNAFSEYPDKGIENAPKILDAIKGIGSFDFKSGGLAQLVTGGTDIASIGSQLDSFAHSAQSAFNCFSEYTESGITNAKKVVKMVGELINFDGDTDVESLGRKFDSFAHSCQSAFNCFSEFSEDMFTKATNVVESIKKIANLTKSDIIFEVGGLSAFTSALKDVDTALDDIIKKAGELPQKMADGIKSGGSSLSESLVAIWEDAVTAMAKPVNKVISGANWILKEFGSDKVIAKWIPYAKGTDGHKGGNALVNDGRGAELIQMPNGNTFIPKGRNVLIPNAPKGMKVLPAENTAQLMGRSTPTFNYAEGTGDIDIWSYIDNAKGLIGAVAKKYVNYNGVTGLALEISKGMVSTVTAQMSAWADKLFEEFGALSLANYNPSKGVEQWRSTVIRALKMEGQYSAANVARTLFQMQTESGGNPYAINLWDSNAKKGIPSKGLMQVIDPTFKAYARAGFDKNIYDPLSNILASIRYAISRYGSLANAYRGVGYANGGFANKPSIFGEDGLEAAIPLSRNKRSRGIDLWYQTGEMLGMSTYSPDDYTRTSSVENNTYAPVFNLTINGSVDDKNTERTVKKWIAEAMNEVFSSMSRSNPSLQEV